MNLKIWKYFAGSVILVGALLLKFGAPLFTVLLGVVAAGAITWRQWRRSA